MPNNTAPKTAPPPDDPPGFAAWLAIPLERWYREVAEANPHRCHHPGVQCGVYLLCDREEDRAGGYQTVEVLDNGELVFHCEGLTLTPNDPAYRERRAGLARREVSA